MKQPQYGSQQKLVMILIMILLCLQQFQFYSLRNYVVHFGLGHTGDCMNNITDTINDNIANFLDGLYSQTRMQLLAWVLQVPSTNRNCGF